MLTACALPLLCVRLTCAYGFAFYAQRTFMKRTTYEVFALASAVEQVLLEELGRLGALSLQDLGRLNERLRAHNLLHCRAVYKTLCCSD